MPSLTFVQAILVLKENDEANEETKENRDVDKNELLR